MTNWENISGNPYSKKVNKLYSDAQWRLEGEDSVGYIYGTNVLSILAECSTLCRDEVNNTSLSGNTHIYTHISCLTTDNCRSMPSYSTVSTISLLGCGCTEFTGCGAIWRDMYNTRLINYLPLLPLAQLFLTSKAVCWQHPRTGSTSFFKNMDVGISVDVYMR